MKKKIIGQTMDRTKTALSESFIYQVKKCGGSSHIMIGKRWLGKYVKVTVEEASLEEVEEVRE